MKRKFKILLVFIVICLSPSGFCLDSRIPNLKYLINHLKQNPVFLTSIKKVPDCASWDSFKSKISVVGTSGNPCLFSGFEVEDGGDVVECTIEGQTDFFTLDYLAIISTIQDRDLYEALEDLDWNKIRLKILRFLSQNNADLAYHFETYLNSIDGPDFKREWKPSSVPLKELDDEKLSQLLPEGCQIHQAVLRTEYATGKISYLYSLDYLESLRTEAPLQYSFILMHEWLRDFVKSAEVIRGLSHFIHLNLVDPAFTSDDFNLKLAQLGLDLVEIYGSERNFCNRHPEVKKQLLDQLTAVSCFDISSFGRNLSLDLGEKNIEGLSFYEFSGLASMYKLDLSHNHINWLYSMQFLGLEQLSILDLSGNDLVVLPAGIFRSLKNLYSLNLQHNRLRALPEHFWDGMIDNPTHQLHVDLSYNQLQDLPADFFQASSKYYLEWTLDLSHNEIMALAPDFRANNFTEINLSYNQLKDIPKHLCKLIRPKGVLNPRPGILNLSNNLFSEEQKQSILEDCAQYRNCRCIF